MALRPLLLVAKASARASRRARKTDQKPTAQAETKGVAPQAIRAAVDANLTDKGYLAENISELLQKRMNGLVQEEVGRVEVTDDDLPVVEAGQDLTQLGCPGTDQLVRDLGQVSAVLIVEDGRTLGQDFR